VFICVNSCRRNKNPATSLRRKDNPAIKIAGLTSTLKNPVVNGSAKQYKFLCALCGQIKPAVKRQAKYF